MREVGVLFMKGFFVVSVDKGQLRFLEVFQNGMRYVRPLGMHLAQIFCKKFHDFLIERKKDFLYLVVFCSHLFFHCWVTEISDMFP